MTSIGDPLVGHVLDGRYQIISRLARGGMATVYRAVDTRLARTVAVKVMHVGLGDDAEFARKFDREARSAARLSHPNVVSVFDQGRDEGRPYIVMEYVEGQTLRDVISREAPLSPLRSLELIEPILNALACAHDAGLVHRDVKPENVLISSRGQIKVADFGLAKAISAQTSTATAGLLIGTVSYLPPELVISGKADARSDIYSTGVVLFELLTGRKPHTGETPIQVAYAHVHTDVPAPSMFAAPGSIPPYLDALLACATAREPDVRPHDAKVMLTQVRRVRAALRDGLVDDPDLTQDLTTPLRALQASAARDAEMTRDRADFEATTFVSNPTVTPPRKAETLSPNSPRQLRSPVSPTSASPVVSDTQRIRQYEQQRRMRRNRRRGWIALVIVLLLTALAATAGWYVTKGRFTTAPALTSMTQDEATLAGRDAGVFVAFDHEFSETVAKGKVIVTDPTAGAKIVSGGEVQAMVSMGPERYPVPKLVGLQQQQAVSALTSGQLKPGKISDAWSETVGKGVVLEASQEAAAKVKKLTAVDLTISAGPKPIKITSYVGKSAADAEASLKEAGFRVKVSSENSTSVAAGLVISQTPKDGDGLKGDPITMVKSVGPVMVTVPMVKAMGVKAATDVMSKAGFKVISKPVKENYLGVGYVSYSDPAAGTKAVKGSSITLYLV